MGYKEYRVNELNAAIERFRNEIQIIHMMRLEATMREVEAFREFHQILLADRPDLISTHFTKKEHDAST